MSDIHEDITFMRTMAEQGRHGPIIGGSFLAAAGLVFGLTAFVQWAGDAGMVRLGAWQGLNMWLLSDGIFAVLWIALLIRLRAHVRSGEQLPGGASQSVFGAAWGGAGLGVCILVLAIAYLSWQRHEAILLQIAPLAAFAFYGTAWFIIALLALRRWMFVVSSLSFTLTLVLPMMSLADMLPVLGCGLFATLLLPGIGLMREAAR